MSSTYFSEKKKSSLRDDGGGSRGGLRKKVRLKTDCDGQRQEREAHGGLVMRGDKRR